MRERVGKRIRPRSIKRILRLLEDRHSAYNFEYELKARQEISDRVYEAMSS
jgi:hypothetical protein